MSVLLTGEVARRRPPGTAPSAIPLPDGMNMMIGRDSTQVSIVLPHTNVSRRHAQITRRGDVAIIRDLRSSNGTFVSGLRVAGDIRVHVGDRVDIGPYSLVFDGRVLRSRSRENNIELVAQHLIRTVKSSETREPVRLLNDISLVIKPGELVCILGSSGSGKSTLMSALSGRIPAEHGRVLLNGLDFYVNFEALKRDTALVPQRETLHDLLTLEAALGYTARLRLSPDTSDCEIQHRIDEMLETVGLVEQRHNIIKHLSGGQLKRASLANEIIAQPSLLFLDEVTSGLDEETDRELMVLFRQLAGAGKTVVCVTHSLANVERTCHLVVILTMGGRLAFIGPPPEALDYFGIERLGDVYERISPVSLQRGDRTPEEWEEQFQVSRFATEYIHSRMPRSQEAAVHTPEPMDRNPTQTLRMITRQVPVVTRRYLDLQLADHKALGLMVGQCLLIASLLGCVFTDIRSASSTSAVALQSSQVLFLMALACIWFGCNNASKEIVKERNIFTRERDVNLRVSSYLGSKLLLLGAISVIQSTALYWIVARWLHLPNCGFTHWLLLCGLSLDGVALGLLISAWSRTEEAAVSAVPIVLMPQIILAGFITPLQGAAAMLAKLTITTYWGYGALSESLSGNANIVHCNTSVLWATIMLAVHFLLFNAVTLLRLHIDGFRSTSVPRLLSQLHAGTQPVTPDKKERLCCTIQ